MKKLPVVILFFLAASVLIFLPYVAGRGIPFPSNLLSAYFQPWKSYQWQGYPPGGVPNKPMGFDALRIFYPLRKLAVETMKRGQLPLWNPYNFTGNTLLSTYQSAIFHPLGFLFFLLPLVDAWSVTIILTPVFAGLFMYMFLAEIRLPILSRWMGAVAFAFAPFFVVWWEELFMSTYSALVVPLLLLGIHRMTKQLHPIGFIIVVGSVAWSILSGWFQMTFYGMMLALCWMTYLLWRHPLRVQRALFILLAMILGILISGIHLVPSLEAFSLSARGSTDAKFLFDLYLLPWRHLITLIAPDFFGNPAVYNYFDKGFYHERILYMGIVPLVFVLYLIFQWKKTKEYERFFLWMFLFTLSLGFALPTSKLILYHFKIPLLSTLIPSRIFFLTQITGAILTAYGMKRFLKGMESQPLRRMRILMGWTFTGLWLFAISMIFTQLENRLKFVALRNLVLPTGFTLIVFLIFWASRIFRTYKHALAITLILISFSTSYLFAKKYLYFSDRNLVYPDTPVLSELQKISSYNRFWSPEQGHIESNIATYYGLFSPEGYDSISIRRYGELIAASGNNGRFVKEIPRNDAVIPSTDTFTDILDKPFRRTILRLLGVRYLVRSNEAERNGAIDPSTADRRFVPVWNDDKFTIFEYTEALPRTFVAFDYRVTSSAQNTLDAVFDPNIDLSRTVVLEETPSFEPQTQNASGSAHIVSYEPNRVTIAAVNNVPALLFLSDAYFPGWKAEVERAPSRILRANYAFRAIELPAGTHTVVFSYKPLSVTIGAIISGLGLIAAGLSVIWVSRIQNNQHN